MANYTEVRSIPYQFNEKHIRYICKCADNIYNIAEGAVRAGKTIDNVYAFAHELKTCEDKIHLATGSTQANAKLNIGDANGFGLEYIFRGQCHWGKYKGNDCLYIKGPKTKGKQKIIIFAGAALINSYKKIRGNSYGMWIATEVNLHHDNTIKEAFNRLLASRKRRIFWDMNPDNPKASIYTGYIDKYIARAQSGELLGGVNYEHFTIFDNVNIPEQSKKEFISQYEEGSLWYRRDILGIRCVAEGAIYQRIANDPDKVLIGHESCTLKEVPKSFEAVEIGVDFGGTGSGTAFVATGFTENSRLVVVLETERHIGEIDPDELGRLFVDFVAHIKGKYGRADYANCDSAESILTRGLKSAAIKAGLTIRVRNAMKDIINNRIRLTVRLIVQDRFFMTAGCKTLKQAMSEARWSGKDVTKDERLDDGSSDIDTMDAFEYTIERHAARLIAAN